MLLCNYGYKKLIKTQTTTKIIENKNKNHTLRISGTVGVWYMYKIIFICVISYFLAGRQGGPEKRKIKKKN